MKQKRIFLLMFLVLSMITFTTTAYASLFIDLVPIKADIYKNESAVYKLVVINTEGSSADQISMYMVDPRWILSIDPAPGLIQKGTKVEYTITIQPTESVNEGFQSIILNIKSYITNKVYDQNVMINVKSTKPPEQREYEPSVRVSYDLSNSGQFDPRKEASIKISFINRNPLDIQNMEIVLQSSLINDRAVVDLDPYGEMIKVFTYSFDPFIKPQKDNLIISVSYKNKSIAKIEDIPISIISFSPFFEKKTEVNKGFLRTVEMTIFTNNGNVKNSEEMRIKLAPLEYLFIKTDPKAKLVDENGVNYLVLDVVLSPKETSTLTVTRDFSSIFWVGVAIVVAIVLYFIFRNPMVVKKDVKILERKEGAITEVKVIISLLNRSNKQVNHLKVVERISPLMKFTPESDSHLGLVAPSQVTHHDTKGSKLIWDIDSLDSLEERIISYRIKPKLTIVGGFIINKTLIKFTSWSGSERIARSNKVKVY